MTLRQIAPFAAGLGVLAIALLGWLADDDDPVPVRTSKRAPVAVERHVPAHVPAQRPRALPRPVEHRPEPELPALLRTLEPEERQELRDLVREEKWADTEARLYTYAETSGWDAELTEEVRTILEQTTTGVGERLRKIDAGTLTWEELKPELREFRLVQANRLRDTLGDPGFLAFAQGMDFWHPPEGGRPGRGRGGPDR